MKAFQKTFEMAGSVFSSQKRPLKDRDFPFSLSRDDLRSRLRKPRMNRVEASLLSLGFLLPRSGQSGFDLFIYDNRLADRLSIDLTKFPLAQAFIEREGALAASAHFSERHAMFRRDEADISKIFQWLEQMEFRLPEQLLELVNHYHVYEPPSASREIRKVDADQDDELNPKERSSLLQIIHALASRKPYYFDETDSRNGSLTRIEAAIADAGLSMSTKTIRKYLRQASQEASRVREKYQ